MTAKAVTPQHTPGPWTLGDGSPGVYGPGYAVVGADGVMILARVNGQGYPIGIGKHPASDANARLIAAAPEMLEALRTLMVLKTVGHGQKSAEQMGRLNEYLSIGMIRFVDRCYDEARAVLAKAEGA